MDEKIGLNLVEDEYKMGYYGKSAIKYETMVLLCVELHKEKEAYDLVQRAKSKALIDLMTTSDALFNVISIHEDNIDMQKLLKEESYLLQTKKTFQLKSVLQMNVDPYINAHFISNTANPLVQQQKYTFNDITDN